MYRKLPHTNLGITLFDLLIAMAILGILMGVAIPSLDHIAQTTKSDIIARQTLKALNFARHEAISYKTHVTICPSHDKEYCSKNWKNPLMVFIDSDHNGKRDDNEQKLQYFEPIKYNSGDKISWKSFGNKPYISFDYDGTTIYQSGRISYCPEINPQKYQRQVIIYRTGRARIASTKELKKC